MSSQPDLHSSPWSLAAWRHSKVEVHLTGTDDDIALWYHNLCDWIWEGTESLNDTDACRVSDRRWAEELESHSAVFDVFTGNLSFPDEDSMVEFLLRWG